MSGGWGRAPWSVVASSGALTGASATVWFEAADRTRLASAAIPVAVAAGLAALVASSRMLRAALRGEDSVAAGRLVGFVIVTEVLAVGTHGLLGVAFVLAAALGLLLSTGRATLAARLFIDRVDGEPAPTGAVDLPSPSQMTEAPAAGAGASRSAREGAER